MEASEASSPFWQRHGIADPGRNAELVMLKFMEINGQDELPRRGWWGPHQLPRSSLSGLVLMPFLMPTSRAYLKRASPWACPGFSPSIAHYGANNRLDLDFVVVCDRQGWWWPFLHAYRFDGSASSGNDGSFSRLPSKQCAGAPCRMAVAWHW